MVQAKGLLLDCLGMPGSCLEMSWGLSIGCLGSDFLRIVLELPEWFLECQVVARGGPRGVLAMTEWSP